MALRNILTIGDELLRKKARPINKFDDRLWTLLDDMAETMYAAPGVGLAAPQVGVLRQVVVIDIGEGVIELINPEIVEEKEHQIGQEGCLSVPGRSGVVIRPNKVKVKAKDRKGKDITVEGEELLARAICHELDHLKGQLYVDIMEQELTDEEDPEEIIENIKKQKFPDNRQIKGEE